MVEGTGFENRHLGNRIGGSNPPVSAVFSIHMKNTAPAPWANAVRSYDEATGAASMIQDQDVLGPLCTLRRRRRLEP